MGSRDGTQTRGASATHYLSYFGVPGTVLGPGDHAVTKAEQGTESLVRDQAPNPGLYCLPKATSSFPRQPSLPGSLGPTIGLTPLSGPCEGVGWAR